jgi:hypothetical protein
MYNTKDEESTDELIEYAESDSSIFIGVFVGLAVLILILAGLYYYFKRRGEEQEEKAVAEREAFGVPTRRTRGLESLTASRRTRAPQTAYQPRLSAIAE